MNHYNIETSIKYWAEEDRPREKLLLKGKSSLSNSELIAILIGSGTRKISAVDLGKILLKSVDNNLLELAKLSVDDLKQFKGIGEAKAVSIVAALELGKRRRSAEALVRTKVTSSKDVYEYVQTLFSESPYESFVIVLLNRANKILRAIQISEGGMTGTVADPKKIFKKALETNAAAIILCHNHPSGNLTPSESDNILTKKLKNAGELLDLPVLDHLIVGDNSYYSYSDEGML
ncbi:MAG: DNA repair protein RadC [Bacteroidota bacterium]|nr:DNA repair protein RadC [Bacteroidota bacterium]